MVCAGAANMPSATKSWHHSLARPPDERRPALRGAFETESKSGGGVESERTWAAGDTRTHTLGLALKDHLGKATKPAKGGGSAGGGGGSAAGEESAKSGEVGDAAKGEDDPSARRREEYYIEVRLLWPFLPLSRFCSLRCASCTTSNLVRRLVHSVWLIKW